MFAGLCLAAHPVVNHGSKVYIEASNGFENYLTAALHKKHVLVRVVMDKAEADYVIKVSAESEKAGWAKTIFVNPHSEEQASISVIDRASGEVVWAYAVNKFSSVHGKQSTAEACAKHLRSVVSKQ